MNSAISRIREDKAGGLGWPCRAAYSSSAARSDCSEFRRGEPARSGVRSECCFDSCKTVSPFHQVQMQLTILSVYRPPGDVVTNKIEFPLPESQVKDGMGRNAEGLVVSDRRERRSV